MALAWMRDLQRGRAFSVHPPSPLRPLIRQLQLVSHTFPSQIRLHSSIPSRLLICFEIVLDMLLLQLLGQTTSVIGWHVIAAGGSHKKISDINTYYHDWRQLTLPKNPDREWNIKYVCVCLGHFPENLLGLYVFIAICVFVRSSFSRNTPKLPNQLAWNRVEGRAMTQGRTHSILQLIQINRQIQELILTFSNMSW